MEEKDLCCEVVHKDDVTRVQQVVPDDDKLHDLANLFTGVWFAVQTGNRCQRTFRNSQDASDRILFRAFPETVSAAFSPQRFKEIIFA